MKGSGQRELWLIFGPFSAVAVMAAAAWFYVPGLADAVRSASSGRVPPAMTAARGPFAQQIAEANAAHKAKDYAREIALYSAALATDPIADKDRRDLLGRRAIAYEWARQYLEAEAGWTAALEIAPVEPSLYHRRGTFYHRQKRYDDALADFAAGVRLAPNNSLFYLGEGDVRSARREYAAAIASYSDAIRLNPDAPSGYMGRGRAFAWQGNFAEARADYERVLADHDKGRLRWLSADDVAQAQLGRGFANLRLKEFARAKDDFDKVLTVLPGSSNALQWRGYALENLGDRDGALADYRAALEIAPDREWVVKRVQVLTGR